MRAILGRLGWVSLPQHRSVVLCVPDVDACIYASQLVDQWRQQQPRTSFFFVAGDKKSAGWLSRQCHEPRIDFPIESAPTSLMFLLMARVRIIICLGDPFWLPPKLLDKAYGMGVPLIVARCKIAKSRQHTRIKKSHLIDWWEPQDQETVWQLRELGVEADRIASPSALEKPSTQSWAKLQELSARRPPLRRPLQRLVQQVLDRPHGRKLLERRAKRVNSIEELRHALDQPQSILCLGNGPSCEDPALDGFSYNSLFRVNYRWRSRGKFTKADVVFTGQKRTLFSVRPRIFGFQTQRAEVHLVTHQIFNPLCRRMTYVTLERFGILKGEIWDRLRPTNGATMIAAAVALKPRRLIIGGIDLFEDPAGAYPGDTTTPNAYVAVHDAQAELKFVLETLDQFEGELIIVGDVLKQKWCQFRGCEKI